MNTPKKPKPLKRWRQGSVHTKQSSFKGGWFGIKDPEMASLYGWIITYWVHVEEEMIGVFEELMTGRPINSDQATSRASREIFRSITSQHTRVRIMRGLLETSPHNATKPKLYDDLIDEFFSINAIRNDYVHGLWMWSNVTQTLSFWNANAELLSNVEPRSVSKAEFEGVLGRMRALLELARSRFELSP